jgi:hypothetical protein
VTFISGCAPQAKKRRRRKFFGVPRPFLLLYRFVFFIQEKYLTKTQFLYENYFFFALAPFFFNFNIFIMAK